MAIARDHSPMTPILSDADWSFYWAFYGADEDSPLAFAVGSKFSLVLAPAGRRTAADDQVYELTSDGGEITFADNVVTAAVDQAGLEDWAPGLHDAVLRQTDPDGIDALYFGQVFIARGLSHLAAMGGGNAAQGVTGAGGAQIFSDAGGVRILRGEAAQALAGAAVRYDLVQGLDSGEKQQARDNIGLGEVDDTSDADKPVSTAQAAADSLVASNAAAALTAGLSTKQPADGLLTAIAALALAAGSMIVGTGVDAVETTPSVAFGRALLALANAAALASAAGLGNVNNTADADKPVSTAQAAADAAVAAAAAAALTAGLATKQNASANLTTFAGIAPSGNVQTFLGSADFAAMRSAMSVVPGTDILGIGGGGLTGYLSLHADPSSALHAVTKQYVDNIAAGLDVKASVRAATTANITLSGAQTIDGVAVIAGDRVLVKDQSSASANGIYVAASGAWARATDMDAWAEFPGASVWVEEGTANADRAYTCTVNAGGTLGSTSVSWTQFGGTGAYQAASANLTTFAAIAPSANVQTFLGSADFAAMRSALSLVIGVNVQAYSANLTTFAGIAPSANVQTFLAAADFAAMRNALTLGTSDAVTFGSVNIGGDVNLIRYTANGAALRNGTTAQGLRIYNTYTDASNGEWGMLGWLDAANNFIIGTNKNGTGVARQLVLRVGGSDVVFFDTSLNAVFAGQIRTTGNGFVSPAATGYYFLASSQLTAPADGALQVKTSGGAGGYHYMVERSDPSAPPADAALLYARDNGSGKTQLVVRFNTGAVQVIATEP